MSMTVNAKDHLELGGCDLVELADKYGTPLWLMDESSIRLAIEHFKIGLEDYPDSLVLYAGKAFLCLSMCHLLKKMGLGLDVVSEGELFTASQAEFPAERIYMHGNNKSAEELTRGLQLGDVRIVIDNVAELNLVAEIASKLKRKANVLFRLIPGIEPDTHQHIKTGQYESKFGIPLEELPSVIQAAQKFKNEINILGLHAHIGSQAQEIEPYLEYVDILATVSAELKAKTGLVLSELDVGGGLGITYNDKDNPPSIVDWTKAIAEQVLKAFNNKNLKLPRLLIEPGRAIVGTAGVTLYRASAPKVLPNGKIYLPVDGGMADNPRPITYQAEYTAAVANRVQGSASNQPMTIVGKYCESGDIIIEEAKLQADAGDLIAVFGTGAYNFSMSSNYNRSPKPACLLLNEGKAEIIIERETLPDLIQHDRVPPRLLE
ncbi:MAG: diaminopimelate decarboxylase [Candidatus Obscuribacterales bacterium]|nr:diaminopimelate decarboxylase [Candidatus Obscuribacterales bacterium]